jgi:divalent metal cation (Fe/Co/Zn/Cd) transporter
MLLAAVTQAVQATPLPSPQIIKETLQPIIQQAPAVTADQMTLIQVGGVALVAWLTSFLQDLLGSRINSGTIKRLIWLFYSAVIAVGAAVVTGDLNFGNMQQITESATALLSGFLVALGSSGGRYQVGEMVAKLKGYSKGDVPADPPAAAGDDEEVPTTARPSVKAGF